MGKVPVDDSRYSLSAILLDDDYYGLLASGVAVTRRYGMPTLAHEYLPVFKTRAFDDLAARRERGERVQSGEVGKHRRDITRLMAIMPAGTSVGLPVAVRAEVEAFLGLVDEPPRSFMRSLGLGGLTFGDVRERIREVYLWGGPRPHPFSGGVFMIERVVVKGFRALRDFEWCPQDDVNILVGDYASGKSTVLDALELCLGCRVNGRRAVDELTPYWFNVQDVSDFFSPITSLHKK